MSKKIIDVAQWNKVSDYQYVKSTGVEGAIIKVINKQGSPDPEFERHYEGFTKAEISVIGGYNYSYATSVAKAAEDAGKMIHVAKGRIPKIWMDVEDDVQKNLGELLISMIVTYQNVIERAGLEFGVYTGLSFYNSYIKPYARNLKCDFWIARYPTNTTMKLTDNPDTAKQPVIPHKMSGWQYSSKGMIQGITGNVDLNIWFDEIESSKKTDVQNPYPEPTRMIKKTTPFLRGEDVKWVQYHLIRMGFLKALNQKGNTNIDGICGNDTIEAIRKAQISFQIKADGICGPMTREFLKKR